MKAGSWRPDGECSDSTNDTSVLVQHTTVCIRLLAYAVKDVAFKELADGVTFFVQDQAPPVHLETAQDVE